MSHFRQLGATSLAIPPIRCANCHTQSYAAGRHPSHLCLVCEAHARKKQGR